MSRRTAAGTGGVGGGQNEPSVSVETHFFFFFLSKQTVTHSCGGNWLAYICSQREIADGVFKRDGARVQNVGLDALTVAFRLLGSATEKGGRLLWKSGWGGGLSELGQRLKSLC